MGLSSVMQTALSGMNAATTILDVTANNLANDQTPGFKASSVELATLDPQTFSLGGNGANPLQIGQGVQTAGTNLDFSQGEIVLGNEPSYAALEGPGFFIVQTEGDERRYTRDGQFRLNADGDLVTAEGDYVLGFAADAAGNLDQTQLARLRIQIGSTVESGGGGTAALTGYSIARDGRIVGRYSDGISRTLGQLRLARFANPSGLAQRSGNKFAATAASGLPVESDPGDGSSAEVIGGGTERSNVDVGSELVEMTLAGNLFSANVAVFQTANAMLGELFFPWRAR